MRLRFYWRERFGTLEPECESDTRYRGGAALICNLLTDTGGLPYPDTLPWLEEGLQRLEAVKRGEAPSLSWVREDWRAEFRRDGVEISSAHESDYAEDMSPDGFEKVLRAWIDFIQTAPDANAGRTIAV